MTDQQQPIFLGYKELGTLLSKADITKPLNVSASIEERPGEMFSDFLFLIVVSQVRENEVHYWRALLMSVPAPWVEDRRADIVTCQETALECVTRYIRNYGFIGTLLEAVVGMPKDLDRINGSRRFMKYIEGTGYIYPTE